MNKAVSDKTDLKIYVYHHTHWDREWYQSFRRYQIRLAEVVDAILDRLEQGVFSCFTLDGQTIVLDDYLELRPWNREKLQRWVSDGKLNIGPWYVMPDEFLVSGESLIRNLKRGIETARAWGCSDFTGYLPDTFGHSSDMPLIFRDIGIETAMVWRGVHPETSAFNWKSRNGQSVLTYHLAGGYFQNMLHDPELSEAERVKEVHTLLDKLVESDGAGLVLVPVGGDHLGPIDKDASQLLHSELKTMKGAMAEEITAPRFLDALSRQVSPKNLPEYVGELRDNTGAFLLPGVYSARLYLKQENRRLEHLLIRHTEPLTACNQLLSKNAPFYPVCEVEKAWELLMQNHPHDSICGCSVDAVHRENEVRFDEVREICRALNERQRANLQHEVLGAPAQSQWILYNMGDAPYRGVVPVREWCYEPTEETETSFKTALTQLEKEEVVLLDRYLTEIQDVPQAHRTMVQRTGWILADEIPAHGMRVVDKVFQTAMPSGVTPVTVQLEDGAFSMENGLLCLNFNPDGTVTAQDCRNGQIYPELHTLSDRPDQGDSYNSAPVPGSLPEKARLVSSEILSQGPLVATVRLCYRFPSTGFGVETRVSLTAGSRQVVFETSYRNTRPDHKLQVAFTTGRPIHTVQAEGHFGVEDRTYDPAYREEDHMPVPAWQELKTNTGPIQRFIQANGHLWITEGLAEYEVRGEELSLTLLRAFGHLSKGDTGVRGAQAGPPFATPEGQCIDRPMVCRYAWMPSPATVAEAYRQSDLFYGVVFGDQGTSAQPVQETQTSLIRWSNPCLVSTAIKWSANPRGLVVRIINTSPEQEISSFHTAFSYTPIRLVNFLEESDSVFESAVVPFSPYSVKTLLFQVK